MARGDKTLTIRFVGEANALQKTTDKINSQMDKFARQTEKYGAQTSAAIAAPATAAEKTAGRMRTALGNFGAGFASVTSGAERATGRISTMGAVTGRALAPATRAVQNFHAGWSSAAAAQSAFTGKMGTFGGVAHKALTPAITGVRNFTAGFGSAQAAASAFTGRMGTFGGIVRRGWDAGTAGVHAYGSAVSARTAEMKAGFGTGVRNSITTGMMAPLQSVLGLVKQIGPLVGAIGIGGMIKSGIDRISSIESTRVSLEVMLGTGEAANKMMDEMLSFAKGTPFSFPGIADAGKNMMAFGMEAGKVIPTLTAIGNAAAATGKGEAGFSDISAVFGSMASGATISLDQINRLHDNGIPALRVLANSMGIPVEELKKQISAGKVDSARAIDDLVKGMNNGTKGLAGETSAMGGLMEKMKNTWVGSLDSLKANISSTMATLLTPVMPYVQTGMAWFGEQFSRLPQFFADAKAKMDQIGLTAVIERIGENIRKIIGNMGPTFQLAGYLIAGALAGMVVALGYVTDALVWLSAIGGATSAALIRFGQHVNENRTPFLILGGIIAAYFVPLLTVLAAKAIWSGLVSGGAFLKMGWDAVVAAGNVWAAIYRMIAALVAKTAAAISTAATVAAQWAVMAAGAIRTGITYAIEFAKMISGYVAKGVAATVAAARTVGAWAVMVASAVWAGIQYGVTIAGIVAGWVLAGVQSLIQAARMAAAWFIALGPIGWVIATIIGLVALIIANWDWIVEKTRIAWDWISQKISAVWAWLQNNVIGPVVEWVKARFNDLGRAIDGLGDWFRCGVDAIGRFWDGLKEKAAAPVRFMVNTVWNDGILKAWNWVKRLFGGEEAQPIKLGFKRGGPVWGPGTGTSDSIDAKLSRGEHVWTAEEVRNAGGHGVVRQLRDRAKNRDIPHFALGGAVTNAMFGIVKNAIPSSRLTSAVRPGDPGYHGRGRAIDVAGPRPMDTRVMQQQNRFIAAAFPGSAELIHTPGINLKNGRPHRYNAATQAQHRNHVHWAMSGMAALRSVGMHGMRGLEAAGDWISEQWSALTDWFDKINPVKNDMIPRIPGSGELPKDLGKLALSAIGLLQKDVEAQDAAMGSSGGGGVERWRGLVNEMLQRYGHPLAWANLTLRRMNQESGGDPRAINGWDINAKRGTPSKGLMQVIDPTFRSYRDPGLPNDIWDPRANVAASMRYATKRYGSLPAAYNRKGGYRTGGFLDWTRGEGRTILAHGGEYILDATTVEEIRRGATPGFSGTGQHRGSEGGGNTYILNVYYPSRETEIDLREQFERLEALDSTA